MTSTKVIFNLEMMACLRVEYLALQRYVFFIEISEQSNVFSYQIYPIVHIKINFHYFQSCMQTDDASYNNGSNMFFIISTLVTFCIPVILLFIPWWALLVQVCGCCTRKLRASRSEFWLSIITIFMILFFEGSRAPFEFFNFYTILTDKENGWTFRGNLTKKTRLQKFVIWKVT